VILAFWKSGTKADARKLQREKAEVLLWQGGDPRPLEAVGVSYRSLSHELTIDEVDEIDEAAMSWTRAFGRRRLLDGRSFRDLFEWDGLSLWWFAELYLHHSTEATRYVRLIETFSRTLLSEDPEEVAAVGLPVDETLLLSRCSTALGILFHDPPRAGRLRYFRKTFLLSLKSRLNTALTFATAMKRGLGGPTRVPEPSGRLRVLFLSHAAFWRTEPDREGGGHSSEHYFASLIPEVEKDPALESLVVAVGPSKAFRQRGSLDRLRDWLRPHPQGPYVHINRYSGRDVFQGVWRATSEVREGWRRIRRSAGLWEAFSHRGVPFADLAEPDLAGTILLQLPWAVRSYLEMTSVLRSVKPRVVCLYAEFSGWGRAAVAACRKAGVKTVALQHGILYPKYYAYRHDPDETDCPRPDFTAVFGEAAKRFLIEKGRYSPDSVVLTGSPKLDELVRLARVWDRRALRDKHGVKEHEKLLVVASRYQGIRSTHQAIGTAFEALLGSIQALQHVICLVKPHPAEPATAYLRAIDEAGTDRVRALAPNASLPELLVAADALVTVESLSAVEALVLGLPVLILNMPTNLRDLVEQGVAVGVAVGEDPLPPLKAILFDTMTRAALEAARRRHLSDVAHGVDGKASGRILDLIRRTAGGSQGVIGC